MSNDNYDINALDNVDSFVIHHSLDYYLHRINKYMDWVTHEKIYVLQLKS